MNSMTTIPLKLRRTAARVGEIYARPRSGSSSDGPHVDHEGRRMSLEISRALFIGALDLAGGRSTHLKLATVTSSSGEKDDPPIYHESCGQQKKALCAKKSVSCHNISPGALSDNYHCDTKRTMDEGVDSETENQVDDDNKELDINHEVGDNRREEDVGDGRENRRFSDAAGTSEDYCSSSEEEKRMRSEFRRRTLKIKAADGGFFENFGTLDKSVAIKRYQTVKRAQQRTATADAVDPIPPIDHDLHSSYSLVIPDSSSKIIECIDKDAEELAILGEEVLYVILNAPALQESKRSKLVQHAVQVFQLDDDPQLLDVIKGRTPPEWKLEVTVHEGRKLKENQPDGSSDPFCEVALIDPSIGDGKTAKAQFRTSVRSRTLNPQWEDTFTIEAIDHSKDILQISVRDQAAEEMHLKERVKQIEQVKGVRGAYRYVRNVAQAAISPVQSNGHSSSSSLGKVVIKLKEIPAGKTSDWFSVERKAKISLDGKPRQMVKKGDLRLTLNCSGVVQTQITPGSLRLFFKAMIQHEVDKNQESRQSWKGELSEESVGLINSFLGFWGADEVQQVVAYWLAAWQTFKEGKRLDYIVLRQRLLKLPTADDADPLGTTERAAMSSTLLDCWSSLLRDISYHRFLIARKHVTGAHTVDILLKTLKVVGQLLKQWGLGGSNFGYTEEVKHALSRGNHHWYQHILAMADGENATNGHDEGDHDLRVHIEVINNIAQDLYDGRVLFQRVFFENVGVDYLAIAFSDFEGKILSDVKPMVKRWCEELRRLSEESSTNGAANSEASKNPSSASSQLFPPSFANLKNGDVNGKKSSSNPPSPRNSMALSSSTPSLASTVDATAGTNGRPQQQQDAFFTLGSQAFELYMAIQNVVKEKERAANVIHAKEDSPLHLDYHNWFEPAMYHWLRIAEKKAWVRTVRAIELDSWSRMDDRVYHSMSAVNTTGIFNNIVIFWRNLDWPDPKGAFVIACHVMRCISECGQNYADEVTKFLEQSNYLSTGEEFEITPQLCAALSSIEHVKLILTRVPDWLDSDRLLSKIYSRGCKARSHGSTNDGKQNGQDRQNQEVLDGHHSDSEARHDRRDRLGRGMSASSDDLATSFVVATETDGARSKRLVTGSVNNNESDDGHHSEGTTGSEGDSPKTPSRFFSKPALLRRRKDTPAATKNIVIALTEIMKAACDPPSSKIPSGRETSDSTPSRQLYPKLNGIEEMNGTNENDENAADGSHMSDELPKNPDKLRDMLANTRKAVSSLMESGVDRMAGKMLDLRRAIVDKLIGNLKSDLQECCRRSSSGSSKLLQNTLSRVDASLGCLYKNVPEDVFQYFIDEIWESYLKEAEILAKKPIYDAPQLLEATTSMFAMCRKAETADEGNPVYSDLISKLSLRSVPTPYLILKYYEKRRRGAMDLPETATSGLVTVQACKTENGVYVHVMNGRNMRGHGRDAPDSYVSVRLYGPWCDDEQKLESNKAKTPVYKQTKTTLYEHVLNLEIPGSANANEAVLIVTANDQHHFKRNYFMGEAILPLSEISDYVPPTERFHLPQIALSLSVPGSSEEEMEILTVLQTRTEDKLALEFVKKQRRRIPKLRGAMGSQMSVASHFSSM